MGRGQPMIEYTPEIESEVKKFMKLVEKKRKKAVKKHGKDHKLIARKDIKDDPEMRVAYDTLKGLIKGQLRSQLEPIVIVDDEDGPGRSGDHRP